MANVRRMVAGSGWLAAGWTAALLAAACAGGAPPAAGSKAAEATAVPPHETLVLDPRSGAVRFLRGEDLGAGLAGRETGDAEAVARAFLAAYAPLFRIADPAAELALQRVDRESSGAAHVRFAQRWQGLPLPGAELIVHLDAGGRVVLVNGSYVPTPRGVDTSPALSAADARRAAARASGMPCADCATDLIVSAAAEEPRLAWRVAAPPGRIRGEEIWVDAQTGAVLRRLAAALPTLAPGPAGKEAP